MNLYVKQSFDILHSKSTPKQIVLEKDWKDLTDEDYKAILSSGYQDANYTKLWFDDKQTYDSLYFMNMDFTEDFLKAFAQVDALIAPTCPNTAFDLGAKTEDPLAMYLTDIATISANLAGLPAISVPAGFDTEGMPIGLQIMTPQLTEAKLFNLSYKFEQAHDYYKQLANI